MTRGGSCSGRRGGLPSRSRTAASHRWAFHGTAALAAGCALALGWPASAQERPLLLAQLAADNSRLSVPAKLTVLAPASVELLISVTSPRDLPPNSFVRLRGLPAAVALTEGFAVAPGVWAVPLAALGALRLVAPVGVSGTSEVTVTLVSVDGAPLAELRMQLVIAEQKAATPGQTRAAVMTPDARDRAEKLVQRGEKELGDGNVAQARAFFMRAADMGLAQGALMVAATFDPTELARLKVQGVQANAAEARKWYERARELGAPEANDRLSALDKR